MKQFRGDTRVARPPDVVFAAFTAIEDIPKYVPQMTGARQVTEGPVGVGTEFHQFGRLLGRQTVARTRVTEFEKARRYAYESVNFPRYRAAYDYTPEGGGTRIEYVVTVDLPWYLLPLRPYLLRMFKRAYAENMATFGRLVEQGGL